MSTLKKVLVSVLVASFAFVAVSSSASAQTYSWTGSLKQGSKGTQVMNLQKFLNLCADTQVAVYGAGSPGMESSSFGPATKAAVIKFQMKNQVMPASGIWGPLSQAKAAMLLASGNVCGGVVVGGLPAGCTTTAGFSSLNGASCSGASTLPAGCLPGYMYSSTTGAACTSNGGSTVVNNGMAGNIDTDTLLGGFTNEQVGVGDTNHQVLGVQFKASAGGSSVNPSALTLQLTMDPGNGGLTGSGYLNKYFSGVSVWQDGKKIGSASASDFGQNTSSSYPNYVYSKTITLSGASFTPGQNSNIYVSVDALPVIDSNNLGSTNNKWEVAITNVRFTDGTGASLTYTPTSAPLTASNSATNLFSFTSTATANNIQLNVTRSSNDANSHVQQVSLTSSTSKVTVLKFKLAATGQTVHVDKIPVDFTTSSSPAAGGLYGIANTAYLMNGSTVLDSEVVPSSATSTTKTIIFKNLNLNLTDGSNTELTVALDINGVTGNFAAGSTVSAAVAVATSGWSALDQNSNNLVANTSLLGGATGTSVALYDKGIMVSPVSTTTAVAAGSSSNDDLATFTIKFSVTAFGGNVYIPNTIGSSTSGNQNTANAERGTSAVTNSTSYTVTASNTSIGTGSNSNWLIPSGSTENFTATITAPDNSTNGGSGQYRAYLQQIKWDSTDTTTPSNTYTFNLGTTTTTSPYTTDYVGLN